MRGFAWIAAAALAAGAAPAAADVKAGVEAWARGDYKAAVEQWRGPAVAGDADAQFNLAQAYKLGRGVPEDPALAESWFRRAALQGHLQAEDNYGLALFQAGKRADAVPWLEKSVARGEPRAQLVLGTMLFNGDGVGRDYPRAYALMTRASSAGLPSASHTLAQMDGYVTPEDRQRGLELARRYEAQARLAGAPQAPPLPSAAPVRRTVGAEELPPSQAAGPVAARPAPAPPRPAQRQVAAMPRPPAPRPTPRPAPAPRPAGASAGGAYRVQLGAFRDAGNARALWSRIGARVGGRAIYAAGGGVTRLQAGPFRTRAQAARACAAAKAAGGACAVVGL